MSTGTQIALGVCIAIVLFGGIAALRRPKKPSGHGEPPTAELIDRVRALKAAGKPIQAIKELRDGTGMSLREAKDYVDALTPTGEPPAPPVVDVREETLARVRELKSAGRPIEAIKLVRTETGWGLRQAKDFVDAL